MAEAATTTEGAPRRNVSREERIGPRYNLAFLVNMGTVSDIRQWSDTHVYSKGESFMDRQARAQGAAAPAPTVTSHVVTTQRVTYKTPKGSTVTFDTGPGVMLARDDEIAVVWIKRPKRANQEYVPAYVRNLSSRYEWYLKPETLLDEAGHPHSFLFLLLLGLLTLIATPSVIGGFIWATYRLWENGFNLASLATYGGCALVIWWLGRHDRVRDRAIKDIHARCSQLADEAVAAPTLS